MRIFLLEDVSIALIAEEITQIGLFFAEMDVLLSALIEMLIAYGFTFYWLTFTDRNFLVLKFWFQTKIRICNDSDSFITLTIMWGSVGRIEKLPLVNQLPTRDYTPLHSATLRSAPVTRG